MNIDLGSKSNLEIAYRMCICCVHRMMGRDGGLYKRKYCEHLLAYHHEGFQGGELPFSHRDEHVTHAKSYGSYSGERFFLVEGSRGVIAVHKYSRTRTAWSTNMFDLAVRPDAFLELSLCSLSAFDVKGHSSVVLYLVFLQGRR